MRYIEPIIGILAFLWVLLAAILPKGRRSWQQSAEIVMALAGMALFGLVLYGRFAGSVRLFVFVKGLLAGISIGVFVTLWLEGSLRPGRTVRGHAGRSVSDGTDETPSSGTQ